MNTDDTSNYAEIPLVMNSTTVNISFHKSLLKDIDAIANSESRSRSELLREAARMYIDRKKRWEDIFAHGRSLAKRKNLTEKDLAAEIRRHRSSKRRKS